MVFLGWRKKKSSLLKSVLFVESNIFFDINIKCNPVNQHIKICNLLNVFVYLPTFLNEILTNRIAYA